MLTLNGAWFTLNGVCLRSMELVTANEGRICSNQKCKHLPMPENVRLLLKDEAESESVNLQLSRIQYPT